MTRQLSSAQVWDEIDRNNFGVLGMVTSVGESGTVGIVYVVKHQKLYIATNKTAWKTKHVAQIPHVPLTIAIPKRVPFMPWIGIPAATITFSGTATVLIAVNWPPACSRSSTATTRNGPAGAPSKSSRRRASSRTGSASPSCRCARRTRHGAGRRCRRHAPWRADGTQGPTPVIEAGRVADSHPEKGLESEPSGRNFG